MSRTRQLLSFLLILACLAPAVAAEGYPRAALLVEPVDLKKALPDKDLVILDARSPEKYAAGHLPSSLWVDTAAWAKAFGVGQDVAGWTQRLGQLGIDAGTRVVIYGDALPDTARVWWILRYWGIPNVQLLHGGWHGWQAAGGNVVQDPVRAAARAPRLEPQVDRLATQQQVLAVVQSKKGQTVDARSHAEYCGDKALARRAGAIPGAIHLDWVELIDSKTQRFKAPEELAKRFGVAGIKLDQPLVSYCQSGGRAAVMAFALELMGGPRVRNYYGSWNEWGNADDTPIVKPK